MALFREKVLEEVQEALEVFDVGLLSNKGFYLRINEISRKLLPENYEILATKAMFAGTRGEQEINSIEKGILIGKYADKVKEATEEKKTNSPHLNSISPLAERDFDKCLSNLIYSVQITGFVKYFLDFVLKIFKISR